MNALGLLVCYLVLVNFVTFVFYCVDKHKAKKQAWRIPEATLLGLAAIGGSVGALLAMYLVRHKTQHPQFKYGVPAILILQIALALWLCLR